MRAGVRFVLDFTGSLAENHFVAEKTKFIGADISAALWHKVKVACAQRGVKLKDAIAQALERWLRSEGGR